MSEPVENTEIEPTTRPARKKAPLLSSEPVLHDALTHQSWRGRLMTEIRLRKLTYDQLAVKMGVSQPQVAKHMQGKARHYHAFVEDACRILDLSPTWILEGVQPGDVSAPLYDEDLAHSWLLNEDFIGERMPVREYYSCPRQFSPGRRAFSWRVNCSDMDDGLGSLASLPEGEIIFCDPDRPVHSSQSPIVLCLLEDGVLLRQLRRVGMADLLVPLNRVYPALELSSVDVQLTCVVIGGLRTVQQGI